jgi:hypothetical protein
MYTESTVLFSLAQGHYSKPISFFLVKTSHSLQNYQNYALTIILAIQCPTPTSPGNREDPSKVICQAEQQAGT